MQGTLTHVAPVRGPAFVKRLYSDTRMGWVWLPFRLLTGYLWLEAGLRKVTDPQWVQTGNALKGFWQKQLQLDPMQGIQVGWYRDFIQSLLDSRAYTWFGPLIAYSECAVGIALILGAFTGLAALGGALLNWNYVMAGTASLNGILLAMEVFLILAWKVAGWIGLDRWILTYLGTPWSLGALFHPRRMRANEERRAPPVRIS